MKFTGKIIPTHTGKIYIDRERNLEFLTVGDYGKEANLKASFLGLEKPIYGVKHKEVDLSDKWVITVSTQKGCTCNCKFCDVPKVGFHGNVGHAELKYMIETAIENENCTCTKRLNLHYARMGEPTYNESILSFTANELDSTIRQLITADVIHPVISTMMPKDNQKLRSFLYDWIYIKNSLRYGEAGLQLSIQSTDDEQRNIQFNNKSLSLKEISELVSDFPTPIGRKYTLNFAVTKDAIIDAKILSSLFNKDKWLVKLTPIHQTKAAITSGFDVGNSYDDYDVYEHFEKPLLNEGWEVIVFIPSKEEDSDRITCGNALLGDIEVI